MATTQTRDHSQTPAELRTEIAQERERLVQSMERLRGSLDVGASVQPKLPLVLAASFAAGFVLAGGIGATMRLLVRRGREGHAKARLGRLVVVDRS
jgi:hypothetical protein